MEQPQSIVTLRVAEDRDRTIWLTEDAATVRDRTNNCEDRLVTFTRWVGGETVPFSTRPDNIVNITENR